jgi:malto-oligosyltrehalose trehalohydrolase
VELNLGSRGEDRVLAMEDRECGWFELSVEGASAGDRYRFRLDGGPFLPDPASRFQPDDVHAASEVIDPSAFCWSDDDWRGRPWEEAVFYELHVGAFTSEGTYAGVMSRLDHLVRTGVTALELMPLADFPGSRNWGYDGVYPFAPDARYGRPEMLKALIQAAHARGLMVFLDVVYNHFGPEGCYIGQVAPPFFTDRHRTPWGRAINFDGPDSRTVREFFIANALYWIEEYHFDGLRLDAVHALVDDSDRDILIEIAEAVHAAIGDTRFVHLILENDDNASRYLERRANGRPRWYAAQWNDDIHHALHVLLTHETSGYYADYEAASTRDLGRALTEGFIYQGEPSVHRNGARRGEPSACLPPTAFVSFLQNHDQIGNRAFGERLTSHLGATAHRAAMATLLLAPSPPLLFMGEEWGCKQPFPFFCDFEPALADAVREGRRREFARFPEFRSEAARSRIPDPNAEATFLAAVLDWTALDEEPHRQWLEFVRRALSVRAREIVPRLRDPAPNIARFEELGPRALTACWQLGEGAVLRLYANLAEEAKPDIGHPSCGRLIFGVGDDAARTFAQGVLPPWSTLWFLAA